VYSSGVSEIDIIPSANLDALAAWVFPTLLLQWQASNIGTPEPLTTAGRIVISGKLKCLPGKLNGSPVPRPFKTWIISSKRDALLFWDTPDTFHSSCCSLLNAPPAPAAITSLPFEIRSTVAMVCANRTGCLKAIRRTAVPSRIFSVTDAIADKIVNGSSLGFANRLSPTQTESRLALSTLWANLSIRSALLGLLSLSSKPLVGRRTPNLTWDLEIIAP